MKATAREALWLAAAALLLGGLILRSPILYDDVSYFSAPEVVGPWPGFRAWLNAPLSNTAVYEPLGVLLHRLLYAAFGATPWPYRLSSLLLHWANAVFVLSLFRLWGLKAGAFAAALFFLVFPAHAETLAVSSFKKHLLVAFFGLLLLHTDAVSRRGPRLALAWMAQGLALLSRESALILPVLALAAPGPDGALARLKNDRVLYAGLIVLCALRILLLPHPVPYFQQTALAYHLLSAGKAALWYISQLAFPADLCPEHDLTPVASAGEGALVLLGLSLAAVAAVRLGRRDRVLGSAAAMTGVALLPYLNLFPHFNLSLVADRYLYLPSLGFFLGAGRALEFLTSGTLRPLSALLAAAYAATALVMLGRYADPVELWERACACAPRNPRAHAALAESLQQRGEHARARGALKRALELAPPRYAGLLRVQMARLDAETGRLAEAEAAAGAEARRKPTPLALNTWGAILLMRGRPRQALEPLAQGLALHPGHPDITVNLGHALAATGREREAEELWRGALGLPAYRPRALFFIAELKARQGRREEALALLRESLALSPGQDDARRLLQRLYAHDAGEPR